MILNTAILNIQSAAGFHRLFLQQDADAKRTIHALVDRTPYTVSECSSSSDGTTLKGTVPVKVLLVTFSDTLSLTVDPTTDTFMLAISGGVEKFSGIVSAAQALELVAFVKACELPSLAS